MSARPRIVLLCATRRGIAVAQRAFALCPDAEFALCTFREEAHEPPFLDALQQLAATGGHRFAVARQVAAEHFFDDGACDLLLAVHWRYILRKDVYARARRGAFVFHDSLLPKYRGFSPTPWAMINGETQTGATLLEMAEEVDRGRIVDQLAVSIAPTEYIDSVFARVTEAYLQLLERNLPRLLAGTAPRREQNEADVTYAAKRRPEDNRIDWRWPAEKIFNLIRACSRPYPGAFCLWRDQPLRIWRADPPGNVAASSAAPGQIVERVSGQGMRVATGDRALLLREVQMANGAPQRADELWADAMPLLA